jgi:LAGLIDADG endonuclease
MKLTPEWIVGFVDGDGGFLKVMDKEYPRFIFVISQDECSINVLYAIKDFFKCGRVTSSGNNMKEYRVDRQEHLENIIFPFFEKYPLQTQTKKANQEDLFKQFTEYRSNTNQKRLEKPYNGPLLTFKANPPINPLYQSEDWFAGFIDAEGCFSVSMVKNIPRPQLILGSDVRNLSLLENISRHYQIGVVFQRKEKTFAIFQVNKLYTDLPVLFKILKRPPNDRLHTIKKLSYKSFLKITESWANKVPKRLKYKDIPNGETYREMLSNLTLEDSLKRLGPMSQPLSDLPRDVKSRYNLILEILKLRLKLNKYEDLLTDVDS